MEPIQHIRSATCCMGIASKQCYSILPTLSKIFEKHMALQIKSYVNEFNLLQKEQSGFREHHSCMTALTKMTEAWLSEMDSGNLTGTVLLDFSKAFDLVSHNILIHKLKVYKFSEQTLTLLRSYLLDRKQEVRIGKSTSEKRNILAGVPQGSVLGPLLFILFIPISTSLPMTQHCITPLKM